MIHEEHHDHEEMNALQRAEQELKRIDHLIYVSLKYTRTVDVFRSVITRLITTGDYLIEALLEYAKEQKVIDEYPDNSALRCELIRRHYATSQPIVEMTNDYKFYRRISRAEFTASNEFRRHVTMTVTDADRTFEIKMETLTEYYKKLRSHYTIIRDFLVGPRDDV